MSHSQSDGNEQQSEPASHDPSSGDAPDSGGTLFAVGTGGGKGPAASADAATKAARGPVSPTNRGGFPRKTTRVPTLPPDLRYTGKVEKGRGGMGRVFLALDQTIGREVAVKELLNSRPGGGSPHPHTPSPNADAALDRFLREARITGRLEHPNIVPVHELGERADGTLFYTMKFVHGRTLASRLSGIANDAALDGKSKTGERLKLLGAFVDICNAVAYAHSKKVLHRDLKPENIMLGEFGETVILDWGLARVMGEPDTVVVRPEGAEQKDGSEGNDARGIVKGSSLGATTLPGALLGTPPYMSPEQARGELEQLDARSDVFALGSILFEILAGRSAYPTPHGERDPSYDPYAVVALVANQRPPLIGDVAPDVPPDLASLVTRAMSFAREGRIASARELADEVEAWRDGRALRGFRYSLWSQLRRTIKRHKGVFATAAAAVVLLMGLWGFTAWRAHVDFEQALDERRAALLAVAGQLERASPEQLMVRAAAERERLGSRELGTPEEPEVTLAGERLLQEMLAAAMFAAEAHQLATTPVKERLVSVVEASESQSYHDRAVELRVEAARVAAQAGSWALADQIVRDSGAAPEVRGQVGQFITEQRGALLTQRRERILFALDDVARGLRRAERPRSGLLLEDYVLEFIQYRDLQTAELLGATLLGYAKRAGWEPSIEYADPESGLMKVKHPTPVKVLWTQEERDQIVLCCRVLGRVGLGRAAVEALAPLSLVTLDHDLTREVGVALGYTGHALAWVSLYELRDRLYEDHTLYDSLVPSQRHLPDPLLSTTDVAESYQRRGLSRLDLGNYEGALEDFDKAYERSGEVEHRANSALALEGLGRVEEALMLLDAAIIEKPTLALLYSVRGQLHSGQKSYQRAVDDYTKTIELDSQSLSAYSNRGLARYRLGDVWGAADDFTKALEINPRAASVFMNRGNVYQDVGEHSRAVEDYSRAIAFDPNNAGAYTNRGNSRRRTGDLGAAIVDYDRAIELDPREPVTFSARGVAKQLLGKFEEALADMDVAIELAPASAEYRNDRALLLLDMGRTDEAKAALEAAVERETDQVEAHIRRAGFFTKCEEYQLALESYGRALELRPDSAEIYADIGRVRDLLGDNEGALAALDKAIALNDKLVYAWNDRSALKRRADDIAGAIADALRAVEIAPNNTFALGNLGLAYLADAQDELAILTFTRLLRMSPGSGAALNGRGLSLAAIGSHREAIADFTLAIDSHGASVPLYRNRAASYHELGEYVHAVADLSKALEIDNADTDSLIARSRSYEALDEWGKAVDDYSTLIALDQEMVYAWGSRGRAKRFHGDYEAAIADLEHAAKLAPEYAPLIAELELARHWLRLDEFRQAQAKTPSDHLLQAIAHATLMRKSTSASDLEQAELAFSRAEALARELDRPLARSEAAPASESIGHAYHNVGNFEKCFDWLSRALDDPRFLDDAPKAAFFAACAAAVLAARNAESAPGRTTQAFAMLDRAALHGYADVEQAEQDSDLAAIRADARWPEVLSKFKANAARAGE